MKLTSLNTFSQIRDDESILLYTHLQVREDAHILYGFLNQLKDRYLDSISFQE